MALDFRWLLDHTIGKSIQDAIASTPGNNWLPHSGESAWLADQKQKIHNERSQMLAPAHGEAPMSPIPRPWVPSDLLPDLPKPGVPSSPKGAPSPSKGAPSVDLGSQPQAADSFDYLDAPWASAYGMSLETAYSEALENTAYQRAVKDMQRAGLNPAVIFGAGRGSSAGSPGFASAYAPEPSVSGGGSSRSRRSYGRGKSSGKLFSGSAYSVMSALGGIVGAAATRSAGGYWLGVSLSQGAMSALDLLNKSKR